MNITYLKHNQIDKQRWDRVVDEANYGMPYAYSWYLDIVCPQWEALVAEDYSYIMPLPYKKKWGIKYLVQPYWVQQLGIISKHEIDINIVNYFIDNIPYLIYDFNLNYTNYGAEIKHLKESRLNLILPPNGTKNYNNNTKRNIKKAKQENIVIKEITKEEYLQFFKANYKYTNDLKLGLIEKLIEQCDGLLFGECSNNILIAILFAAKTDKRVIYLAPVSNGEGLKKRAMFLLVDKLVDYCAENGLILDFEGSQIDGVKQFYKGFGATEEYYLRISKNYLARLLYFIHKII